MSKTGRESVKNHARSASLVSEFIGENIQLLRPVISNELMMKLYQRLLSHATIKRIIYDCFKMKKVISRWVPHQLTDEQKRGKLCRENFKMVPADYVIFMAGDET